MYNPCKDPQCPHPGELTPEEWVELQGPEIGALMVYVDPHYERWHQTVVRVLKRSYVWSPEVHRPSGYHGYRRYDWSVIQTGPKPSEHMVVDDDKLVPLALGTKVVLDAS